jgi:hypothetical protein
MRISLRRWLCGWMAEREVSEGVRPKMHLHHFLSLGKEASKNSLLRPLTRVLYEYELILSLPGRRAVVLVGSYSTE